MLARIAADAFHPTSRVGTAVSLGALTTSTPSRPPPPSPQLADRHPSRVDGRAHPRAAATASDPASPWLSITVRKTHAAPDNMAMVQRIPTHPAQVVPCLAARRSYRYYGADGACSNVGRRAT